MQQHFLGGILTSEKLYYDMIKPKKGSITLTLHQRVQLRVFARFKNVYVTLPRGGAKTHGNLLGEYHEAIWYPKLYNSMSAETREQSAKIMKEKWNEITGQFPSLKSELAQKPSLSKDNAEFVWRNGSITNNLQNAHTVKGLRRHRLRIEESARINSVLFDDALKPVADTVRPTASTGQRDPSELNHSIHFFTTTTFKNCSEHVRTKQMIYEMCRGKGSYVCGADWRLPVHFGWAQKSDIEAKKRNMNPVAFDMNYGMQWVGASDDRLADMQQMMDIRKIRCASLTPEDDMEYVISVDVAKSKNAKNNSTIFAVLGFTRNKNNTIKKISLVYMKKVKSSGTYAAQALELKRLYSIFNPITIVVDAQSYGQGFIEACTRPDIDPLTGKPTDKLATFNKEGEYGIDIVGRDAIPVIYAIKSSKAIETPIIVNFQGWVSSNRFEILADNNGIIYPKDAHYDDKLKTVLEKAHLEVSNFLEEVANLKAEKYDGDRKLKIVPIVKSDKDRYSAVAYGLYYINKYENVLIEKDEVDISSIQSMVTEIDIRNYL